MLRKSWLTSLSICISLLTGCYSSPKVNYCIPDTPEYGCADGPMPMEHADGMICTDIENTRSVLRDCKLGIGLPNELVVCVAASGGTQMACSNGKVEPAVSTPNTYTCLSSPDFDRLLVYCKRKAPK